MHDERTICAQQPEHRRDPRGGERIGHADDLAHGAGRVRERPEQVKCGADPDLAPRWAGVLHRRVKVQGE